MENITRTIKTPGIGMALSFAVVCNAQAAVRFVDPNSPGPIHNGTSWTSAYTSLQTALSVAVSGDEIWVANGTYLPTTTTDRTISFAIPNEVKVFGGFAGFGVNEASITQRDVLSNRAILSGNIGNGASAADNSFTVVTFGNVNSVTSLDGFFITGGNANGGGASNQGAGMRISIGSPFIQNCLFVGNTAASSGGAVLCTGDVAFNNCVFSGNTAAVGAAIDAQGNHFGLLNCTVANNNSTNNGGSAVRLLNGDGLNTTIRNSILYGNSATGASLQDQQISITNATALVDYCCIQGFDGSLGGVGNINSQPVFVDANGPDSTFGTVDDNLALRGGSPGIDAGNNALVQIDLNDLDDDGITNEPGPFDIDHQSRKTEDIVNNTGAGTAPIVDMGAYELTRPVRIICVNDTATGANNGTTWQNAYTSLQDALFDAGNVKDPPPEIIWVAQGTYKPSVPAGRAATFQLVSGASMYGGFDDSGTEGSLSQRNPHSSRTILSGDIGVVSNNTDNCFHVVTALGAQIFAPTSIDGFIITAGNANGVAPDSSGAGLRASGQSAFDPVIRNCKFVGNTGVIGTALDSLSTDISIVNCVFSGNAATSTAAVRLANPGTPSMVNCTIANNPNGGLQLTSSVTALVTNCIAVSNGGSSQSLQINVVTGGQSINYSCIEGLNGALGGTGNIGVLPSFVDANGVDNAFGTVDDDYRLLACSSVIDASDTNALPIDAEDLNDNSLLSERVPVDAQGATRLLNDSGIPNTGTTINAPDIGAFEFQGTSGPPCPADCFPIGAPNNVVNIDDLVTVITQWGACVGGNCAGDVFPPCKNQVIDIDDLVSVITSWGNCP